MTLVSPTPVLPQPAAQPTLYFIGVTSARSSIQRVFPRWAEALGLDARLQGIDLPIHADPDDYRRVVKFIAADPLSLGALVTTHKIDLYRACVDLFDEVDRFAEMMGETSCLSKNGDRLICHAKDPISSGLAMEAMLGGRYWTEGGTEAVCLGAGGSTIAISWYLSRAEAGKNVPEHIAVTNRSADRLDHVRAIHAELDTPTRFTYHLTPTPEHNDAVVAELGPGALVVNATGLGKDAPGSPLSDDVRLPERGVIWDLNYRGDLVFLDQARAQQQAQNLRLEDGWTYFLHGWTQVIAEVFQVEIPTSGPAFDQLGEIAASTR